MDDVDLEPPDSPWYPARVDGTLVIRLWSPSRCPGCGAELGPGAVRVGRWGCSCPTAVNHEHATWRCRACGLLQIWHGCTGPLAQDGVAVTWDRWPPRDAALDEARRVWGY